MAKKYDWGDGKGKAHSRPKGKQHRRKSGGGGGGKPPMDVYAAISAAARGMAEGAFAPQVRAGKGAVKDAEAQAGVVDKTFDHTDANTKAAAGTVTSAHEKLAQHQGGMTGLAAGQQTALGQAQAAEAQRSADIYGQSAKAAEVATQQAQGAAQTLTAQGNDISGFLGALGVIHGQQQAGNLAASGAARGEAHTAVGREVTARKGQLTDVLNQRATASGELASGMIKDQRDFELAQDTLGVRDRDSARDYRVALKTLGQRKTEAQIADENADASRNETSRHNQASERTAAGHLTVAQKKLAHDKKIARQKRAADKADDGKINGSTGDGTPGSAKVTYSGGRNGRPVSVTPDKLNSIKTNAQRVRALRGQARREAAKGGDVEKRLRGAGLRGRSLELALTALRPGGRIPRNLIGALATEIGVDANALPNDFAKLVER
jgi:hypothetical protein